MAMATTTTTTQHIPIEIDKLVDTSRDALKITNPYFYLNKTDMKYHIAGIATNILHTTIMNPFVNVILYDKSANGANKPITTT
jgi:hypothetical protein